MSLEDFLTRVPKDALNKKTLESLARAGALDEFGDRRQLFDNVEVMVDLVSCLHRNGDVDQLGIFGAGTVAAPRLRLNSTPPSTEKERLAWEKELLGTFVSKHPLKELGPKLAGLVVPVNTLHEDSDGKKVRVGGIIASMQKVRTKNNEEMIFMRLEDLTGSLEVIVFPKLLQSLRELLTTDRVVVIEGKVNVKDRVIEDEDEISVRSEAKVVADSIAEATDEYLRGLRETGNGRLVGEGPLAARDQNGFWRYQAGNLVVRLPREFGADKLKSLKQTLEQHPGEVGVEIEVFAKGAWQRLKTTTKISKTTKLERDLVRELSS